MATSGHEKDFGDAMWTDDFYLSPSVILGLSSSNHIYNLKKIVLPNSGLSQLISAYLQESPKANERQKSDSKGNSLTKSGPLQASPSLIALEKILNKEDGPAAPLPQTIIEEEEEPVPYDAPLLPTTTESVPQRPYDPKKAASSLSVTTFQTAFSSERNAPLEYLLLDHQSATTLSTIQDVTTPRLEDKENSDGLQPSSPVTPSYEPISVSPSLSLKSTEVQRTPQYPVSKHLQRNPADKLHSKPSKLRVTLPKTLESSDEATLKLENTDKLPKSPKYLSLLGSSKHSSKTADVPEPRNPSSKETLSANELHMPVPVKEPKMSVPAKEPKMPAPAKEPKKETPSNPDNQAGETPNRQHMPEKPINTKRFSFRKMFKSKSKNHSLAQMQNVPESPEPSRPVKLSHKSSSTPDFSSLKMAAEAPLTPPRSKTRKSEPRKNLFTRKRSEGNVAAMAYPESATQDPPVKVKEDPPKRNPLPEKPLPKVSSPKVSTPKISTPKFGNVPKKSPTLEQSAMTSPSVFSVDTPPAATTQQRETIREVDDSDFISEHYQDSSRVNAEFDAVSGPGASPISFMHGQPRSFFKQSLDPKNPLDMGSPFAVQYDAESFNEVTGKHAEDSPRGGPSLRSTSNRSLNALLAGEDLFPKLADPQEVESIVSMERSRSMRSIRSNTKRSSFINYNGSDENILLGADVGVLRQGSMKNLGGILKNSLSTRSLRGDILDLNDNESVKSVPNGEPLAFTSPNSANDDEHFTDFIEFTDYIDIENLDFADTPSVGSGSAVSAKPSPAIEVPEVFINDMASPNEESKGFEVQEVQPPAENVQFNNAQSPEPISKSSTPLVEKPEIVVVSSPEQELASTPQLGAKSTAEQVASPMEKTYEFAVETSQPERNPSKGARPVSMSFKGFKGSAFKDKVLVQSGSHQLLHFENELFENSPVGQGFGSSEEDSDSEEPSDLHAEITPEESPVSTPQKNKRYSMSNGSSTSRRQQHMRNVLDLQPPRASIPFHHNRIPSISDHSAASSPKLLSSFMSRIRRSPMTLPRMAYSKPSVKFSSRIILYDTYHQDEYDRRPEIGTCNQLTPYLAQQIKDELNELKANMAVHTDSICYTQFF